MPDNAEAATPVSGSNMAFIVMSCSDVGKRHGAGMRMSAPQAYGNE
ncbi:hypothetical protein HNQ86_002171 [Oleiagrimonas soli]|uniref:Uncharacterized protein n=1 Tax=Oleiagrimonas soli TaxID=1543381 RepID=A0A841KI23_9GAMM|nr:hypothetical protein [Oleiagrimonas soli]